MGRQLRFEQTWRSYAKFSLLNSEHGVPVGSSWETDGIRFTT